MVCGKSPADLCGISSNIPTFESWNDSTTSGENPQWRRQIMNGASATTDFDGFIREIRATRGDEVLIQNLDQTNGPCYAYVRYSGTLMPVSSEPGIAVDKTSVLNDAKRFFIQRAKAKVSPLEGLTTLGELVKTLHMIRNPAKSLRSLVDDYFNSLKKVSRKLSPRARRKKLVDTYLEATYGWQPLIADVRDGLSALNRYHERRPFEIARVVGCGKGETSKFYPNRTVSSTFLVINFTTEVRQSTTYKVGGGVKLQSMGSPRGNLETFGLLPKNFLPTAWELIPYSFLVDYFTNISTIIDAWSFINGNLAWAYITERSEIRTHNKFAGLSADSPGKIASFNVGDTVWVERTVQRRNLSSLIPNFGFRLPGFGSRKALNIAALVHQGYVPRPYY
jgi:hypothetical protein